MLLLIIPNSLCVTFKTLNAFNTLKHKPFLSRITTDAGVRRRYMTSYPGEQLKSPVHTLLKSQKCIEI